MPPSIKPLFLFSDSQLLFWRFDGTLFLERIRRLLPGDEPPKAAYLSASNGDEPAFYDIFLASMGGVGITTCRMIPTSPSREDLEFLDEAGLILLAGGDVERGWRAFVTAGLKERILSRYAHGAILIGLSAGAVQLGVKGWRDGDEPAAGELFDTFGLVPFLIGPHEGPEASRLPGILRQAGGGLRGLSLPPGGGAILYPDLSLEPVRHPATELILGPEGRLDSNILMPPSEPLAEEPRPPIPVTPSRYLN